MHHDDCGAFISLFFFLQFFVCFGFWFLSFQYVFQLICCHIWWILNQIISICLLRRLRRLQHHCWRQQWGWLWRLRLRHSCSWIFYTLSDLIFKFASVLELMSNIFNALELCSIDLIYQLIFQVIVLNWIYSICSVFIPCFVRIILCFLKMRICLYYTFM